MRPIATNTQPPGTGLRYSDSMQRPATTPAALGKAAESDAPTQEGQRGMGEVRKPQGPSMAVACEQSS